MSRELPHVCFIAPNAFPLLGGQGNIEFIGGAELQQVLIARQLVARGYRISMICLDFGQADGIIIDGITVLRAFRLHAGIPVLRFLWPRLLRIWASMKRADADIYYQRAAGLWTGVMVAFCRWHRKRSVFAAAGNPDFELVTSRIRYARDRWIYSFGLEHVDRILVQNEEQALLCRQHHGREAILIPNLYSLPAIRRMSGKRRVLWVSTIRQIKRPQLYLDLARKLPELNFRMIGGPGRNEAALYDTIQKDASSIGNLEFLGFVPYSRIEEQFDDAAILVNTSDSEGFPNAFLQAWARCVPSISFVDAGARLDGEPVGMQVKSLAEMQASLAELMSQEAIRVEMGEKCRAYVIKVHSPEQVLGQYEQLFANLLAGPR